jgi:predicted nucleotidyltransferase
VAVHGRVGGGHGRHGWRCCRVFELALKLPKLGSNIPKMGISTRKRARARREQSLADALFSRTQQGVLGLLFGQPDRSFYATEVIDRLGVGSGAVQRELARLEHSGLVSVTRLGTQKHFQANPASPLYTELCGIAQKTVGLAEPVRSALAPFAESINAAFIYGSVAKRSDTASSDIDLMVLSDSLAYADIYPALETVGTKLGRVVNPTVLTRAEWARRLKEGKSFATRVMEQAKLWIYGTESDLTAR